MPCEGDFSYRAGHPGADFSGLFRRALAPGEATDLAKHALTQNKAHDAECGFSPDGQWIAYTSGQSGDMEIWAMRSDGSHQVQLTHNPGYDGGPFFSPDGKLL